MVGAGTAGLTAARRLMDADYEVVVLEARDRIGGRIHTVDTLGVPIDLGGAWIHGSGGSPLTAVAREIGAETVVTDYNSLILYGADGEVPDPLAARGEAGWNRIEGELFDLQNDAGNDQTVADGIVDAGEEKTARDPVVAWNIDSTFGDDYAADPDEVSLAYYGSDKSLPGPDLLLKEGYLPLLRHIAGDADVRLGRRVTLIEHAADGVVVHTDQGTLEADWAIVTVPLGVLQNEDVEFDPPLPAGKRAAIDRLGMGTLDKVVPQPVTEAFNGQMFTDQPILVAFRGAQRARDHESQTDDETVAEVVDALSTAFGVDVPDPDGALVTRWARDPFARGSYSYLAAGSSPDDMKALAAPVGEPPPVRGRGHQSGVFRHRRGSLLERRARGPATADPGRLAK